MTNRAQILIDYKTSPKYNAKGYKGLLALFFDVELKALRKARQDKREADKKAQFEAKLQADIDAHGFFCMELWSRDCDMCESTSVGKYYSVEELEKSKEEAWEWAEGPMTWTYISVADAQEFEPSFRDRIMENFENGGDGFHL